MHELQKMKNTMTIGITEMEKGKKEYLHISNVCNHTQRITTNIEIDISYRQFPNLMNL